MRDKRKNFSYPVVQENVTIHIAVKVAFHSREFVTKREKSVEDEGKIGKTKWIRPTDEASKLRELHNLGGVHAMHITEMDIVLICCNDNWKHIFSQIL